MTTGCIFCTILAGAAPVSPVHEDEQVVAFMDLFPVNPGHLLVVPRHHAAAMADLDDALFAQVMTVGRRLAAALRATPGLRCDGVNLFLADGEAAGQEVFHLHLHVIPRFTGDRFRIEGDWENARERPRAELDQIAAAIRTAVR